MNKIDNTIYDNLELLPYDCQGWGGTLPIFSELISTVKPRLIIEVGSWKGQSAITMAKTVKELKLDCKIICVDTWLGALEFWDWEKHTPERNLLQKNGYPQIYYQFLSNVVHDNVQDIITPFPNTSSIAARYFKNQKVTADLIYIDASHDEEDVYLDIQNYIGLLSPHGIIFGDDYIGWDGVNKAVNRFIKDHNKKLETSGIHWKIINCPT
jgi:predicted O-methyltransferase YrrM